MIPKITHQVWVGGAAIPGQYMEWRRQLLEMNPDWEHKIWIAPPIEGVKPQFVSNMTRMEVLRDHGGLYLDMDVEVFHFLSGLKLNPDVISCDWFMGGPHYAVIAAPKGHPAIAHFAEVFTRKVKEWRERPRPSFLFEMRRRYAEHTEEFEKMRGVETANDPAGAETVLYHHLYTTRRNEIAKGI
jgi:mannosyltransferase OCH1-like enzyme